jgi:hypothetical protein
MPGVASERAHQLRSGRLPLQEAPADAEDVVVAKLDHPSVDHVGGDVSGDAGRWQ